MSSDGKSKNDIAWEAIFIKHDLLNVIEKNRYATISADQIRIFRESRKK